MNTKAFTLIELVAVVLILSAILSFSFPTLINITKKEKEENYDNMVENICLSAKTYIYSNQDDYEDLITIGNKIVINVNDLISYGIVKENTTNKNDLVKFTVLEDYSLKCEYIEG